MKYNWMIQYKTIFDEYSWLLSVVKWATFEEYRECASITDEQIICYYKIKTKEV